MKAIILAAGQGQRLQPYTNDRPKCLVEVADTSLLDLQLEVLRSRDINEIILVGGYRSTMLLNRGSRLYINARYAETNMVWTLFCAEEELDSELVIAYGDIVYSGQVLDHLLANPADVGVAIDTDWESYWTIRSGNPLLDAETLKLGDDGEILEIGRRPSCMNEIEGQYMGLMKFTTAGIESLKSIARSFHSRLLPSGMRLEDAFMTDLLQVAIDHGVRVDSVPVQGGWIEVDTVSDLHLPITSERVAAIREGILK